MILGSVNGAREAIVSLRLRGAGGRELEVGAILDTGFSHDLTLPAEIIEALDLEFVAPAEATIAGELVVSANYYRAQVVWDGRKRRTSVLEMEGTPLLGMGLLQQHRVTLEVLSDGPVTIEPLSDGGDGS